MYVVLTANYDAGILQFAKQITKTLSRIDETVLFAPSEAISVDKTVELYERKNSINPMCNMYKEIASRISALKPSWVFACESNLITSRIICYLDETIKVAMCVHDVVPHPSYLSYKAVIKGKVKTPYIKRGWKRTDSILLLSEHSRKIFQEYYPSLSYKVDLLRLGAHVPDVNSEMPPELTDFTKSYYLFFGRIDKYKGLFHLLNAYSQVKNIVKWDLVVAGNGTITDEEQILINENKERIHQIKRYIKDEEMCWLFEHSGCTVLPYIEASQSGVLSISFHFGKPVIVSNVEGLTEFVVHRKTGLIFNTGKELCEYMTEIESTACQYRDNIHAYYMEHLDWEKNLRSCLEIS